MRMKRTRIIPFFQRRYRPTLAEHSEPRFSFVDKKGLVHAIREHPLLIALAFLLLAGTVLGAMFARKADASVLQKLDLLFVSDVKARAIQSSGSVFVASLGSAFFFVAVCFLLGMSLWGFFVLPFIPLYRGFGFGLASGYLYAAYGFEGVLFNAVVVLPGAFLSMIAILLAAKEGMSFSRKSLFEMLRRQSEPALSLQSYAIQFGSILILAAVAAAVDLVTTVCFTGAFSF